MKASIAILVFLATSIVGAHHVLVMVPAQNDARCQALGEAWVNDANCDVY